MYKWHCDTQIEIEPHSEPIMTNAKKNIMPNNWASYLSGSVTTTPEYFCMTWRYKISHTSQKWNTQKGKMTWTSLDQFSFHSDFICCLKNSASSNSNKEVKTYSWSPDKETRVLLGTQTFGKQHLIALHVYLASNKSLNFGRFKMCWRIDSFIGIWKD